MSAHVNLPDVDVYGRAFGHGLASTAAKLQLAARTELRAAAEAFGDPTGPGARSKARAMLRAADLLGHEGPFLDQDGQRLETIAEVLHVTAGARPAVEKLRAVRQLPASADGHLRRAIALAAAAAGIRQAVIDHPAAADGAAVRATRGEA